MGASLWYTKNMMISVRALYMLYIVLYVSWFGQAVRRYLKQLAASIMVTPYVHEITVRAIWQYVETIGKSTG